MKCAGVLLGLLCICGYVDLQAQEISSRQSENRILTHAKVRGPFLPADSVSLTAAVDTLATPDKGSARLQADTLINRATSDAFFAPSALFRPTPRKAVIYSALFPGMGQVYNRKYWKLPILYGGFVGFTYAITWNNGLYRDYLGGYQDIMDSNPETNRWHNLLPYGRDPGTVDVKWFTDVLQKRKDYYRYYRDLSIIGTVALYMLAMVDAYVDAQLFDFDISPDLSMRVEPAVLKQQQTGMSAVSSYGLQLSFNF
ncbi:MAG: DUF5683 domain-containing protein [Proteiniphilum sp.]|nr:DUF5683 domain-containing protein [Proteiniphilum sp.]MDD4158316.1 DUF5683 domain-containing protein [Proteiniphilum sp.]MDD4800207.1 DUF5683 domain-containing protein [Proteiniphilum sp.]